MSSASATSTSPAEGVLAGRYSAVETLTESAASSILLAVDAASGREVVMKVHNGVERSSFLREASASLSLEHSLVASPQDALYLGDGQACLVFEYFSAGTLRDHILARGKLPEDEVIRIILDLADGLAYLHGQELIHCDLKPENVFLRQAGERYQFVIGDLGATCTTREAREGNHRVGSPAYTAPERFSDRFGPNSDLYSLGVMAVELLTGNLPFLGTPNEIARAHINQPMPIGELKSGFQKDLIHTLTAKNPADRIASAAKLSRFLTTQTRRVLDDIEVVTAEPQRHQGTWRPGRIEPLHTLELDEKPDAMHLLSTSSPIIVCEYPGRLQLVSAQTGKRREFPRSGPVRTLSHDSLIYVVDGKLVELSMGNRSRRQIVECGPNVLDISSDLNSYFWRTARSGHIYTRASQEEASFVAPHYLLSPHSAFLGNGRICVSEGGMNDHLVIRDLAGVPCKTAPFDGPIAGITGGRSVALAVTMNMGAESELYHVWEVSEYAPPKQAELTSRPTSFATTAGHVFVGDEECVVQQIVIGLVCRELLRLPAPANLLAVATDHSLLAALEDQTVHIYSNTGVQA
ncbi:MAG: serine/threonine-protein kinase [Pseudomonadota bacterium]